jgi:NADPH:quinone reductase-like Zn-dependent oxidoreductase
MRLIGLAVVLAFGLTLGPLSALAQVPPRIGMLSIGTDPAKPNPVWIAFLDQLGKLFAAGKLRLLVTERFPFDEAPRVHRLMVEKKLQGRVLLVP